MNIFQLLDTAPEPPIIDWQQFNLDYDTLSGDYKLATPLADFQKELTDQIVSLHYSDILKFFERVKDDDSSDRSTSFTPQEQLIVDSLETLLMNSQLVCTHPYLLIDHYFPKSLTAKDVPRRIEESSGKFKVLKQLLEVIEGISDSMFNLVILSRPGKTIDLLDAFLLGQKCVIKRYSGTKLKDNNSSKGKSSKNQDHIIVHLIPSDQQSLEELSTQKSDIFNGTTKVDLLISFDISCDTDDPAVLSLRKQTNRDNRLTPILRLVPINTIEHIALYYRDLVSSRNYSEYLKPVTAALVVMRDRAGTLTSALRPIYAKKLAYLLPWLQSLKSDTLSRWMLPDLAPIPYFHTRDVEKSLLTEVKYQYEDEFEHESNNQTLNLELPGFDQQQVSLDSALEDAAQKNSPEDELFQALPSRIRQMLRQKTDYYEKKRLKREYLSNPLVALNYSDVTGIAKNSRSEEQSLHNEEVLTHKLIQGLSSRYSDLTLINLELKSFDDIYDTRQEDKVVVHKALSSIIEDLDHAKTRISISSKKVARREQEIGETLKPSIQLLQGKIDDFISENVKADANEGVKKYVENEVTLNNLKEQLESLTLKLESQKSDIDYTSKEVTKAEESIINSQAEVTKLEEQISDLKGKVAVMFETPVLSNAASELARSKASYEAELLQNKELVSRLDDLFKSLNETQIQRVRHGNARGTTVKGSPMLK
ncbi:unnamed protein product [Kuraishia capsulata CBS 1993]|uniref:HDA1 complex subunit 2 n=1 Tax=Kuraishia capsulata CBS 1993 TaxID=1382522 RepID=W6MJV3_9ASCO|nr:uncharacterized protein KUCA_T00002533001 [Kuraishia capsulata CBS 1993]CDK26561.1 unnamed protein product [Kuraishia capsulata CBS 1993]